MTQKLKDFVKSYRGELIKRWHSESPEIPDSKQLNALSKESFQRLNEEFCIVLMDVVKEPEQEQQLIDWFSKKMDQVGWPLTYLIQGKDLFKKVLLELFLKKGEPNEYSEFSRALDESLVPFLVEIVNQYRTHTAEWEQMINVQRLALRELSAPLIPVFDKISVMPLIGTIDTERAKLIMENLLQGVITHESQVVLIDITGVPVVDTMVAHHIIQAAEAVRLVGAKCIIVGIRPEIAQTIVTLGIDLTDTPTLSTLRKGINEALKLTGRQIIDIESS